MRTASVIVAYAVLASACGSPPPPKEPDAPTPETTTRRPSGPTPQVSQELGSIDQGKVEQTFHSLLNGKLETCHKQGRDRIEFLTGDVKVFLRIDASGHVRYGYFEETTLGDRETEKCILGVLKEAAWPKPDGGEAEVRSGFGWGSGGEREPTTWKSDQVQQALLDARASIDKCKAGVTGNFSVTAYVEVNEEDTSAPAPSPAAKPKPKPKGKKGGKELGGHFKAIGVSAKSKEGGEKIDCIIDALKGLELPNPGSYAAKVSFTL